MNKKNWACIKYLQKCKNHDDKMSYIVPLMEVGIEGIEFNKNKSYLVKCRDKGDKWCNALVAFILQNSKYFYY